MIWATKVSQLVGALNPINHKGLHQGWCNKRRELRQKRFKPKGSEKYTEVNNNIKKSIKKAKEN